VQDVVLHGETGLLCPPGDERAWLAVIAALTGDAATRRPYARRAREVAEGRTWAAVFERLLGEYREIVDARRVPRSRGRVAGQRVGG
jgi:phosphatidylinositol alpha 1,6-mannosyltransferase